MICCMCMQCKGKLDQRVCIRAPDCRIVGVQVIVWTILGMFLNPGRVGPFFAAATGFMFHIVRFYRGLESQLKEAKMKLKKMIQEFRANLPEELTKGATKIADQIEGSWMETMFEHDIAKENGSSSMPKFVAELMEDYANQKIQISEIPAEVKRRLLGLVNAKLEAHGMMDEVESVMQIRPMVSAGDHQGVARALNGKIFDILWAYLDSRGFPVLLKALMEDAMENKSSLLTIQDTDIISTAKDLRDKAKDLVQGLIKDELAPRALAGPESMHPILASKLTGILTRMIDEKGLQALRTFDDFSEKVANIIGTQKIEMKNETMADSSTTVSTGAMTDNLTVKLLAIIDHEAQQKKVIDSLEFLMQLCAISGNVRYRHWAISSVLLDMLLRTYININLGDVAASTKPGRRGSRDSVGRIVVEDGLGRMGSCTTTVDQVLERFCDGHNKLLDTLETSIESVRERIGLPGPIDSDDDFEGKLKEILQIARDEQFRTTHDVIRGKYGNYFVTCSTVDAMKSVQDEIMKFIYDKVNDTFDTDLGSALAQKLHVISNFKDANEKKTHLSLLETQIVNFAQNQVLSSWLARKGTKLRPSLFERLRPFLYREHGPPHAWRKITQDKTAALTEVTHKGLKEIKGGESLEQLKKFGEENKECFVQMKLKNASADLPKNCRILEFELQSTDIIKAGGWYFEFQEYSQDTSGRVQMKWKNIKEAAAGDDKPERGRILEPELQNSDIINVGGSYFQFQGVESISDDCFVKVEDTNGRIEYFKPVVDSEPEEESWTSTNADDSYFEGVSLAIQ
jgi:hypothetical protein